jgi:hypothetical protein
MPLLTLTINNASPALDKKFHEAELITRGLRRAAQDIGSQGGLKGSGNIIDHGGVIIGSWTLTNQAST